MENNDIELPFTLIEFQSKGMTYVSVAPKSWRLSDGSFYWPPTKLERKAIIKPLTPNADDWTIIHQVKILGQYATYKEAMFHEKRRAQTDTESETFQNSENTTKRRVKKNKKFLDSACSPPPQLYDDDASLSSEANSEIQNEMMESKVDIFQNIPHIKEVENYTINKLINEDNISEVTTTPTNCASEIHNKDLTVLIDIMLKVQETMRIVSLRLSSIEEKLSTNPPSLEEECLIPSLPIADLAGLKSLEVILREEKAQKQLFQILRFIGGSSDKNCVNRCLQKVFSNYLAMFCS